MSAAQRQCVCGAPLPPDDGSGSVKCRACGRVVDLTSPPPAPAAPEAPDGEELAPSGPALGPGPAPGPDSVPVLDNDLAPPPVELPELPSLEPEPPSTPSGPPPAIKPRPEAKQDLHVNVPGEGQRKFVPPAARPVRQPAAKAELAIKFHCACGQVLHSRRLPGTQVMCPACGQILEVPGDSQEDMATAQQETYKPRIVIHFQCSCGDMLRSEEGVGSSVMCLNCGREAITPPDGAKITQFQCECGEIIESPEPGGSETLCPSCNKSIPVPVVEEG
ncbi:MAG: hypothetical protein GXP25_23595 [Planctomycetes bacterium]|nr:hypothetical protein [Planctomycetota bacterium]